MAKLQKCTTPTILATIGVLTVGTVGAIFVELASASGRQLGFAPPHLVNPITVSLSNAHPTATMDPAKDYVVNFPSTPITTSGGVRLFGGHNVVAIGGEVLINSVGSSPGKSNRGLYLQSWTGTMHIEGVYIAGTALGEGIDVGNANPNTTLHLENIRVDTVRGSYVTNHARIVQNWGGPITYDIDGLTASSNYQGLLLQSTAFGPKTTTADFRNVNLAGADGLGQDLIDNAGGLPNIILTEFYVSPAAGGNSCGCSPVGDPAWPQIRPGQPAGGDFVPAGLTGLTYTSPGYTGSAPPPVPISPARSPTPTDTPTPTPTPTPTVSAGGTTSPIKTVFIVMMENTNWSAVKGSSSYPYVNSTLLPTSAHAERYYATTHPSLPNYVALEAGDPLGLTSGAYLPTDHSLTTTDHLTTYLNRAGISWKYYAENLPGNGTTCNLSDPGTPYSEDHNPYAYFDDVKNNTAYCQSHERPFTELAGDLTNQTAQYNFIVPNDYDQGEKTAPGSSCRPCQADTFLKKTIPRIQASAAYANGGAILVLWDENRWGAVGSSGLIVNSLYAKTGYASYVTYGHPSTLRTMQTIFNVGPFLRAAASATDLSDMFRVPLASVATP